ncbi:MAG: choice-of-anchor Q domain-containing protein [Chloroflexota bacterium]
MNIAYAQTCTAPGSHDTLHAALDDTACATITFEAGAFPANVTITRDVTLRGENQEATRLDGQGQGRVLTINADATVVIENLAIINGTVVGTPAEDSSENGGNGMSAEGGGIHNAGNLTLRRVLVDGNTVTGGAGATGAQGSTGETGHSGSTGSSADCDITGCDTAGSGGTGFEGKPGGQGRTGGGGDAGMGGGIYNSGTLVIEASIVSNNRAYGGEGGTGGKGGKGGKGGTGGKGGARDHSFCQVAHGGSGGRGGRGGPGGVGGIGGTGGDGDGAGIYNTGTLTLTDTQLIQNVSISGAGGANGVPGDGGDGGSGGSKGSNAHTSLTGCVFGVDTHGSRPSNGSGGSTGSTGQIGYRGIQGLGEGGGLYNVNSATFNGTTVAGNTANWGGGIFNEGEVTLRDGSLLERNDAIGVAGENGSGVGAGGGGGGAVGFGGGLYNAPDSTANISYSTMQRNRALGGDGGNGATNGGQFTGMGGRGGGLEGGVGGYGLHKGGDAGYGSGGGGGGGNATDPGRGGTGGFGAGGGGGGGRTGGNCGGDGGAAGFGGGNGGSPSCYSGSAAGGGGAGLGGAIANRGSLVVGASTFYSNTAIGGDGGRGAHGSGNASAGQGLGGALYTENVVTLGNSTFSNNHADQGGGLYQYDGNTTIAHNTFVENIAQSSGHTLHKHNGQIVVGFTIMAAANISPTGISATNCSGELVTVGFNMDNGDSCGLAAQFGDLSNTDPQLGPLQNNGGWTWTHHPLDTSPVIDAAPECPTEIDQRDAARQQTIVDDQSLVQNLPFITPLHTCDIGAVEVARTQLENSVVAWQNYHDWTLDLYHIGHAFRINELTRPANNQITTLDDITRNYANHNEGELYWRYCNDFASIEAGVSCAPWQGEVGRLMDEGDTYDIHNVLTQAKRNFATIYNGPTLDIMVNGQPMPLQSAAISGTLATVRELTNIHLIYGNEFMVDALRYAVADPGQAATAILENEIAQLQEAQQQFDHAATIWLNALTLKLNNNFYLAQFVIEADLEAFAIASERQNEALLEIVQRQRLLAEGQGEIQDEIMTALAVGYAKLYLHTLMFVDLVSRFDNTRTVFMEKGGAELVNGMAQILQLAESIRIESNPLGYDPTYVPLATFEDLLDRMLTNEGGGIVAGLEEKEAEAAAAQRDFDADGSVLQDPTGELYQLRESFNSELSSLCGNHNNPGFTVCDGGKMMANFHDVEAANERVALAWQRAANIPTLIDIEEHRAAQVIMEINNAAVQINAYQLSIAKLEGYQKITSVAQTNEIYDDPNNDPNNPGGGAFWLDFSKDAFSCVLAGATAGKLGDGCQGNVDNLFDYVGQLLGIDTEPSKIETITEVWNPQAEQIARLEGMKEMREAERNARIEGINSAAEVQRLLLQQSDLLIEYEIAVAELNRTLAERNLLIERYRYLNSQRRRAEADYLEFIYNPAYRIIRDNTGREAELAFTRTQHYAYLTARALDYKLLGALDPNNQYQPLIPYNDLYQARTAQHLRNFLDGLQDINIALPNPQRSPQNISYAQGILGLTNARLNGLLPYTPNTGSLNWPTDIPGCTQVINNADILRRCLVQQNLRGLLTTDPILTGDQNSGTQLLLLNFATSLEMIDPARFYWNQRIAPISSDTAGCGSGCQGLGINIITSQSSYPADSVQIRLTHSGVSNYRRQVGGNRTALDIVQYSPGPTALVGQTIPQGFPQDGATTAVINASLNGTGGFPVDFLSGLSSAATDWRLEINLSAGPARSLDINAIDDIVLEMDMLGYPVQGLARGDYKRDSNTRIALFDAGQRLEQTAYAPTAITLSKQPVTDDNAAQSTLFNGFYDGSFTLHTPANVGTIDLSFSLTETVGSSNANDNTLTGWLCASCNPTVTTDVQLTGSFDSADGETGAFAVISAPFTQQVNGRAITRQITLAGEIREHGDVLMGDYVETFDGLLAETADVEGTFMVTRWSGQVIPASVPDGSGGDSGGNVVTPPIGVVESVVYLPLVAR